MMEFSWQGVYQSDLQSVYALLVLPFAFLVYRLAAEADPRAAVVPSASRFVAVLTIVFAIETMIDPIATGPLLKQTPLGKTAAASMIPFLFVYLGDLRVLLLAKGVAHPELGLARNLRWAAVMALIVPVWAGVGFALAGLFSSEVHDQILWILYELGFLMFSVGLSRLWVSRHFEKSPSTAAYLRTIFGFSAAYYSLWLAADLLILGAGLDLGWAIRIVPNQLYYAVWAPFAYWHFFSRPLADAALHTS